MLDLFKIKIYQHVAATSELLSRIAFSDRANINTVIYVHPHHVHHHYAATMVHHRPALFNI